MRYFSINKNLSTNFVTHFLTGFCWKKVLYHYKKDRISKRISNKNKLDMHKWGKVEFDNFLIEFYFILI